MAYICNFDLNLKAPNRSAPNQRCVTEVLFKARFTLRVKLGKMLLVRLRRVPNYRLGAIMEMESDLCSDQDLVE